MKIKEIEAFLQDFVKTSPENTLGIIPEKAWEDELLIGYSNGADELYSFFKKDIGDFLMLPEEFFHLKYPDETVEPSDLTVISWVLPQSRKTREAESSETEYPALRWSMARHYGEAFNRELGRKFEAFLNQNGILAVSPLCSPDFTWAKSEKYGFASNWSERHAAYVSGHGTFGLCDGLITKRGKAVRFGSCIAKIKLEPTKRPYTKYNEYCLGEACLQCGRRCPAGAVSAKGHDKMKCALYAKEKVMPYMKETYHVEGDLGCGLCQTKVPCEFRIPGRKEE